MSYMYLQIDECLHCREEIGQVEGDYWEHTDTEMTGCVSSVIFATPRGGN